MGLGKVGNKEKKKFMYAFNITPMKTIERNELILQPTDVTDNPFDENELAAIVEHVLERDTFFLALRDAQSVKTRIGALSTA